MTRKKGWVWPFFSITNSSDSLSQNKFCADQFLTVTLQNSEFFQQYDVDVREPALGDGSFSVCRRCIHRVTGQEREVKIVSRRVDCSREINLLRVCQGHPNVVR